ncbi:MAG: protein kinase [Planctomycetota bacterium]
MSGLRFERIRPLGSGASGAVDLCRLLAPLGDLPAGAEVAVKTLAPSRRADPAARAALAAEAEAGERIRNPSLVRVLGAELAGENPVLVLQYVPGRSLREILDAEGRLPEPLVRGTGAQLAGALAALHEAGIVHGDVKPENARLDAEGRAVLLDLGFAVHGGSEGLAVPPAGHAGSLAYLSPERAEGGAPAPTADVFALGIVLYELATGVHPFGWIARRTGAEVPRALFGLASASGSLVRRSIEEPGADRLLAAIGTGRSEIPSRLAPEITPLLDAVLADCLARSPAARPAASELARRLAEGEAGAWWRARVGEASPVPSPSAPPPSGPWLVPLIGRGAELAVLGAAWNEVWGEESPPGRSAIVSLEGTMGSGKWRLVKEFVARIRETERPPLYLYARASEASEVRPGGALLLFLHRWLELPPETSPGPREEARLRELVARGTARTLLAALGPPAGLDLEESVPAALAAWLTALGRRRALLLFLDDLQRAGAGSLDSLSVLLGALHDTRILLLLGIQADAEAARPDLLEGLRRRLDRLGGREGPPTSRRLPVGPLPKEAMLELVEAVFHPSAPRRRLSGVLWTRSRGNPGLIVEILKDLLERGVARPRSETDGRLVLDIAPSELPRPRSLDGIVAERFARLRAGEREWLERMAAVGAGIDPAFLLQAFPVAGRAELDGLLAGLVRAGWLVAAGSQYRFERPALREALLQAMPRARRTELHGALARGLAPAGGGSGPSGELSLPGRRFQRIFHLRAAGEHRSVVEEACALIEAIGEHSSSRRLYTLARWGLEALDALGEGKMLDRRLELLEVAADAADRLGHRDDQRLLLDRLVARDLDAEEEPAEAARLYLLHARYAAGTGQLGLARGMLRNAGELASASGREDLESEASWRLAQVQGQIGEFGEARALTGRALETAVGSYQVALAHLAAALLDVLEDKVEDALRGVDRALSAVRHQPSARLGVVAQAHLLRGRIWRSAGRPRRALGGVARALTLAGRAGERVLACEARARLGALLADLGRTAEAETQLRDALLVAGEIEDRRAEVLAGITLGMLLWEGDDEAALSSVQQSTDLASRIGFSRAEAVGRALLARIQRAEGRVEAALEQSRLAMALLTRHGAELVDRIVIEGTRALVLEGAGRAAEAAELVRRLRRRIRRSNRDILSEPLREAQADYTARLLDGVLSPEGPVLPRSPSPGAEEPPP